MRDQHGSVRARPHGRIRGRKCWCLHTCSAPNGETSSHYSPTSRCQAQAPLFAARAPPMDIKMKKNVHAHRTHLARCSFSAFVAAYAPISIRISLRHFWSCKMICFGYGCGCGGALFKPEEYWWRRLCAVSTLLFPGRGIRGANVLFRKADFEIIGPCPPATRSCWFSTVIWTHAKWARGERYNLLDAQTFVYKSCASDFTIQDLPAQEANHRTKSRAFIYVWFLIHYVKEKLKYFIKNWIWSFLNQI